MVCLKYFFVIFAVHLPVLVKSQSNTTQTAQEALYFLRGQMEIARRVVFTNSSRLWTNILDNTTKIVNQQLTDDVGNFTHLVKDIATFAPNAASGYSCLSGLDVFLDIEKYNVNATSTEEQLFSNLLSLTIAEMEYVAKQHNSLYSEFTTCVKNGLDCDSINNGIVAEAERLAQIIIRLSYQFLIETNVLGYKVAVHRELIQSMVMIDYNKVIQNATVCLAYKTEDNEVSINSRMPQRHESIEDDYLHLKQSADKTFTASINAMHSFIIDITARCQRGYLISTGKILDAIFRANQTINTLLSIPEILNVTTNCTAPDLQSLVNSSLVRALDEYRSMINVANIRHDEGVKLMDNIRDEVNSIKLQTQGCSSGNISCEYVSKKIAKKTVEIPFMIQRVENATSLLMYQPIAAVWDSGAKIVRGVLEQLEVDIVALKSCVRISLP